MELLKQLYAIHSPSGNEKKICQYIKAYIRKNVPDAVITQDGAGNLYVTRGVSDTYPCVVAHLDQVQKNHSKDFRAVETEDLIFGYSPSKRRQEGLGADDKNGIWIALRCLRRNAAMKVALFTGEEVGCKGSGAADLDFFSDCRFVIEPDRRGYNDLITQISFQELCSKEFLDAIRPEKFGYKAECGLMTDVEALKEQGVDLSCINLSCGYYHPHTDEEFTVKKDLVNCLDFVQHIIENCVSVYKHEGWQSTWYFEDELLYGFDDSFYDLLSAHPDYTAEDAWDVYSTNFAGMTRENFISLYKEYAEYFGFELPDESNAWNEEIKEDKVSLGTSLFSGFLSGGKGKRAI